MRQVNVVTLKQPSNASQNGAQIDSNQLINVSFHAVFDNNDAAGTFKIQASNDVGQVYPQNFVVTNWVDIPSATVTVSSGTPALITLTNAPYRWLRAVWTRSGGGTSATNVTVSLFAQGI